MAEIRLIESELRAMDIRIRAAVRAGELLKDLRESGERATGGTGPGRGKKRGTYCRKCYAELYDDGKHICLDKKRIVGNDSVSKKTLADFGITPDQSSQWQQLAGVPKEKIDKSPRMATLLAGKRPLRDV